MRIALPAQVVALLALSERAVFFMRIGTDAEAAGLFFLADLYFRSAERASSEARRLQEELSKDA